MVINIVFLQEKLSRELKILVVEFFHEISQNFIKMSSFYQLFETEKRNVFRIQRSHEPRNKARRAKYGSRAAVCEGLTYINRDLKKYVTAFHFPIFIVCYSRQVFSSNSV